MLSSIDFFSFFLLYGYLFFVLAMSTSWEFCGYGTLTSAVGQKDWQQKDNKMLSGSVTLFQDVLYVIA